jgi:DNA mismatch repair protein MutL
VHPAKIEVRFRHSQVVHDFARDSIRMALSNARPVPSFAASSAKTEAVFAAGASVGVSAAQNLAASAAAVPARSVETDVTTGNFPTGEPAAVPPSAQFEAQLEEAFELSGAPDRPVPQRLNFEAAEAITLPRAVPESGDGCSQTSEPLTAETEAAGVLPGPRDIGDLKPLGQINASYIVAVNTEGLWIIDQHVAHERVLFEKHLAARHAGAVGGQRLLMPIVAELSPHQIAIFEQIAEELRANGFEAELMGPRSVAISAAPAGIASANAEKLLAEILDGVARESQAISLESLQARIAASTACQAAIKVNMPLDQEKMEWLLAELAKADYPMSCPHGRPVVLRYSVREIERAFKRI